MRSGIEIENENMLSIFCRGNKSVALYVTDTAKITAMCSSWSNIKTDRLSLKLSFNRSMNQCETAMTRA